MEQKSKFNLSIHGLRGLAAISVVFFHVYGMGAKNHLFWIYLESVKHLGAFFVCIFFCISGYLITQTLEKHNSLRTFAKNRLVRIYPVFLLLHLVMFTFGPIKGYDWMGTLQYGSIDYFKAFFANLLFLPGVFDLPLAQKDAWSLSFEALFYILAGLVWKISTTLTGITKIICLSAPFAVAIFVTYYRIYTSFFLIGVGCYLIQKYYSKLPPTYRLGVPALLVAAIAYQYHPLLAFPFLCIFFVEVVQEEAFSAQLLRTPPMRFLGTISYSLYLSHSFTMDLVRSIAIKIVELNPLVGDLFLIVAGPIFSVIIAWIIYELIERKLTKLILAKP